MGIASIHFITLAKQVVTLSNSCLMQLHVHNAVPRVLHVQIAPLFGTCLEALYYLKNTANSWWSTKYMYTTGHPCKSYAKGEDVGFSYSYCTVYV